MKLQTDHQNQATPQARCFASQKLRQEFLSSSSATFFLALGLRSFPERVEPGEELSS